MFRRDNELALERTAQLLEQFQLKYHHIDDDNDDLLHSKSQPLVIIEVGILCDFNWERTVIQLGVTSTRL